jgi:hypothetical protein
MRTLLIASLAAGLGFGLAHALRSAPAGAQVFSGVIGAGDGGTVTEEIVWTKGGKQLKDTVQRAIIKIPRAYGEQIAITTGDRNMLWYVDAHGVIRNVVTGMQLVRIETER